MENEIVIHSEQDLKSKIYTIRGMQVMLDFDLAEIYGYSVKAFNQQVKNNIEKFDNDFRFQLTWEELEKISFLRSRSKFLTLNTGRGSNIKYLPYAFTEQGIYMLMTVLRGNMAVQQSKMLIRLFKGMKDFILEREHLIVCKKNGLRQVISLKIFHLSVKFPPVRGTILIVFLNFIGGSHDERKDRSSAEEFQRKDKRDQQKGRSGAA